LIGRSNSSIITHINRDVSEDWDSGEGITREFRKFSVFCDILSVALHLAAKFDCINLNRAEGEDKGGKNCFQR